MLSSAHFPDGMPRWNRSILVTQTLTSIGCLKDVHQGNQKNWKHSSATFEESQRKNLQDWWHLQDRVLKIFQNGKGNNKNNINLRIAKSVWFWEDSLFQLILGRWVSVSNCPASKEFPPINSLSMVVTVSMCLLNKILILWLCWAFSGAFCSASGFCPAAAECSPWLLVQLGCIFQWVVLEDGARKHVLYHVLELACQEFWGLILCVCVSVCTIDRFCEFLTTGLFFFSSCVYLVILNRIIASLIQSTFVRSLILWNRKYIS